MSLEELGALLVPRRWKNFRFLSAVDLEVPFLFWTAKLMMRQFSKLNVAKIQSIQPIFRRYCTISVLIITLGKNNNKKSVFSVLLLGAKKRHQKLYKTWLFKKIREVPDFPTCFGQRERRKKSGKFVYILGKQWSFYFNLIFDEFSLTKNVVENVFGHPKESVLLHVNLSI